MRYQMIQYKCNLNHFYWLQTLKLQIEITNYYIIIEVDSNNWCQQ
jgi:hypothetical protein